MEPVQSALAKVKGVKEAKVSFEQREAVVTYNPDLVKPEDLIKAVREAKGMHEYDARLKQEKRK